MLVVAGAQEGNGCGKEWAGVEGAPPGAFDRCRFSLRDSNTGLDAPHAVRPARAEEMVNIKSQE